MSIKRLLTYTYHGGPVLAVSHTVSNYMRQFHNATDLYEYFRKSGFRPFKTVHSGSEIEQNLIFKSHSHWVEGAFVFKYGFFGKKIERVRDYVSSNSNLQHIFDEDFDRKMERFVKHWDTNNYYLLHYAAENDQAFDFLNTHYTFVTVESDDPFRDFLELAISSTIGHYSMRKHQEKFDMQRDSIEIPKYLIDYFYKSYNNYTNRKHQIKNRIDVKIDSHLREHVEHDFVLEKLGVLDQKGFQEPQTHITNLIFKKHPLDYISNKSEVISHYKKYFPA